MEGENRLEDSRHELTDSTLNEGTADDHVSSVTKMFEELKYSSTEVSEYPNHCTLILSISFFHTHTLSLS